MNLKMIDKDELRQTLKDRPGYEYDQADYLIDQASYLFPLSICDEAVFRNLILATWVFERDERPRTLEGIIHRLRAQHLTWAQAALNPPVRNAKWYERVQTLQDEFDWGRMGPLFVTPVTGWREKGRNAGGELEKTPTASLFLVNGAHCSLAAMTRIEEKTATFQPVEVILVLPRVVY